MPLYIADYLADTGHLGTIDHGAYLLMMMHYWTKGPLPTDDGQLRKIARMTSREWADARGVLLDFFHLEDGVYRHKRIDAELAIAQEFIEAKSKAGSAGAAKRWHKHKLSDGTANAPAINLPIAKECARIAPQPIPQPIPQQEQESKNSFSNGVRVGNGKPGVTIKDPDERISRFQQALVKKIGPEGWGIVAAATQRDHPEHKQSLAVCKRVASEIGKGWPHRWPIN